MNGNDKIFCNNFVKQLKDTDKFPIDYAQLPRQCELWKEVGCDEYIKDKVAEELVSKTCEDYILHNEF